MKKTLLKNACAIIAACATIFLLGSCSQPAEEARIDTVYSLDRPEVIAKAYPGMNIISWKPVTGAIKYDVFVYEEGVYQKVLEVNCCSAIHTSDLVNGKKYTYYVEVQSATNPSGNKTARGVFAKNNCGEASVKAIVPPFSTKPLELPAYEKGYKEGETKTVDNDEWVVNPSNINVAVADGKIAVTFPIKAYLEYSVGYYNNDLPHEINSLKSPNDSYDSNTNNILGQDSFDITSAGNYQIAVKASSKNDNYVTKDEEVIYGEITIPGLDLSAQTGTPDIYYTDKKNVRVSFAPAKDAKGADVPANWYTVYRTEKGKYESTKITDVKTRDTINSSGAVVAEYYVDDEVGENIAEGYYTYTIVVSNEGKYGKETKSSLPKNELGLDSNSPTSLTSNIVYYILDTNKFVTGADKTVRISFIPAKKNGEYVPTSWYSVYRRANDDLKKEEVKLTAAVKESTKYYNNVTYYVDDTVPDVTKSYTYTVVVTDGELYGKKATLTLDAKTIGSLSINISNGSLNGEKATWTISGNTENAKLTAKYLAVTDRNSNVPVLAQEILEKGTDMTLVKVANSNNYTVEYSTSSLTSDSANVYVLVQATKDGYKTENYISNAVPVSK